LLFGVDWGNPVAGALLVLSFVLVASGASMLLGCLLRTEQQAIAVGLLVGLGMAGLGGAMVPSELFSDTMQKVSRITPHSWALDGFAELIGRGAGIGGVLPQAGVLLGAATVLLLLASWRLRRAITA
jgi:ABC-2 type transport system permease protein